MLLLTGLLQLGKAGQQTQTIDADSQERISIYLQVRSRGHVTPACLHA